MPADLEIFARTLWGEARGEGYEGLWAVASVVINRVKLAITYLSRTKLSHPLYGDGTFASACQVPYQFSCWNAHDPNFPKLKAVTLADHTFGVCFSLASHAISGNLRDIVNGATHYYDSRMPLPPQWAEGKQPCAVIGHHLFFKNV
jgi:N-acetylmuramoyl-L-alanine amidase